MFLVCAIIFLAIAMLAMSAERGKVSVVMCNSTSCTWNKLCRCTRRNIAVYDNTVKGLCLHHSESMKDRVLEPMKTSKLLERYEDETQAAEAMNDIKERFKDEELLKNPNAFAKWMRKHGIGKQIDASPDGENAR